MLAAIVAAPFLIARAHPLAERVPRHCLELLVASGIACTLGIVFFMLAPAIAMPTRPGTASSSPARAFTILRS